MGKAHREIYEVDPLICPRCSSKMRVLAVITNAAEVKKILRHLIKIGCPPPGLDPALLRQLSFYTDPLTCSIATDVHCGHLPMAG